MPHDPKDWMWAEALGMLERAERLHRQVFQLGCSNSDQPAWEPPLDVFETDQALLILVALPGVMAQDVEVICETGHLWVRGIRPPPQQFSVVKVHRMEIPYGRFERQIVLPTGTFELNRTELVHGCLVIRLRKVG